ncbi:HpcH/HpaI aldolase/citrate lyase family protein [Rhodovulum sulfidophilum]|uniref:HpcH/HpaI aldolase/citrate lyase family protein n=1 Tax=Rhodovulum sulfidophilum TaxID=35806 RepID=UPI00095179A2|nr:CoA ester lyase [Rhodovulum sulfidophilum]MBL3551100.1 CoA ester lyase [Rhodovulum sulfidophilum]OLS49634.1 CoA ester lyase [Rhodovulum sulfidophilum]
MDPRARPFRSVLYIPGSKDRALDKARGLPVDAIIFDLEDAVAVEEKPAARTLLAETLKAGGYGGRFRIVRVNGFDTPWGRDDVAAIAGAGADAVLLPKVETTAQLDDLAAAIPDVPLWAMMETPKGILNAEALAAHPRLEGFVMGTNDLAKELGCRFRPDRLALTASLTHCLLAARVHGIVAVDGVYNAFKDEAGLKAECEQGRDLGFDGKTLIHPAQIAIANAAFAPTEAEIDLARRQIAAFEEAERAGQGVAVVDGRIVENLHIVTARETLAKAAAIAELEAV